MHCEMSAFDSQSGHWGRKVLAFKCCIRRSPSYGGDIQRREFIRLVSGAAAAWPFTVRAQQGDRIRRIGVLTGGRAEDADVKARIAAFEQALQQLGWTQGRNVRIDYRFAGGDAAIIRKQAEELVALASDVIVSSGSFRQDIYFGDPHRAGRVRDRPRSSRLRLRR